MKRQILIRMASADESMYGEKPAYDKAFRKAIIEEFGITPQHYTGCRADFIRLPEEERQKLLSENLKPSSTIVSKPR